MMKIVMVSGSWPPDSCGVGDYSAQLSAVLAVSGVDVVRFGAQGEVSARGLLQSIRQIRKLKPDLVHIQYPTVGYGRSLAPAALSVLLRLPIVVTLHEFASFRFYRLPWFMPYTVVKALIFTSGAEQRSFRRRLHRTPRVSEIIPIGSNIPVAANTIPDLRTVCYFGLLMPNKGIEDFLSLARLMAGQGYVFSLIGSTPVKWKSYGDRIVQEAKSIGIRTHLNETSEAVATLLKESTYAYLPFPDGVTEKRGSLLATIVNGLKVMGPFGANSIPPITNYVVEASSPEQARQHLLAAEGGVDPWSGIDRVGAEAAFNWLNIGERHVELYRKILTKS